MNVPRVLFALALILFLGPKANAQGTNAWADGFPKTGDAVQTIKVQGTATAAQNWSPTGKAKVQFVQVGGGPVIENSTTLTVDTTNGKWGPNGPVDVGGPSGGTQLTSGVNYNTTVYAEMKTGLFTRQYVATDPKQAQAK